MPMDPGLAERKMTELNEKIRNFFSELIVLAKENEDLRLENIRLVTEIQKTSKNTGGFEYWQKKLAEIGIKIEWPLLK